MNILIKLTSIVSIIIAPHIPLDPPLGLADLEQPEKTIAVENEQPKDVEVLTFL